MVFFSSNEEYRNALFVLRAVQAGREQRSFLGHEEGTSKEQPHLLFSAGAVSSLPENGSFPDMEA